jgi:hypothetical protein
MFGHMGASETAKLVESGGALDVILCRWNGDSLTQRLFLLEEMLQIAIVSPRAWLPRKDSSSPRKSSFGAGLSERRSYLNGWNT